MGHINTHPQMILLVCKYPFPPTHLQPVSDAGPDLTDMGHACFQVTETLPDRVGPGLDGLDLILRKGFDEARRSSER